MSNHARLDRIKEAAWADALQPLLAAHTELVLWRPSEDGAAADDSGATHVRRLLEFRAAYDRFIDYAMRVSGDR